MSSAMTSSLLRSINRALISVTDKYGVLTLCEQLLQSNNSIELLSTGGTYKELSKSGIPVREVSTYTRFPEILNGRVKTLHPKIHAGLLSIRDNHEHQSSMNDLEFEYIDLVVVNLYDFKKYASKPTISTEDVIEQIDIGGVSILRSAAKNYRDVVCISSISQYSKLVEELQKHNGQTSLEFRQKLGLEAFINTSNYDLSITTYLGDTLSKTQNNTTTLAGNNNNIKNSKTSETLEYIHYQDRIEFQLKYGLNPHQVPAYVTRSLNTQSLPFNVLNGRVGYINLLDALNAWQLVIELSSSLAGSPPVAASFKHASPAGVAVGRYPLTIDEADHFDLSKSLRYLLGINDFSSQDVDADEANKNGAITDQTTLTKNKIAVTGCVASALIRARNCDPLCSFGDFIAISSIVDETAAIFLKNEVSDGIIAAGYTNEALAILNQKKSTNYVVLQANLNYAPPLVEYRELYGVGLVQRRNDKDPLGECKIVTQQMRKIPSTTYEDIRLAAVTLKYTQSNSVCFAQNGQAIGVAAGQQSRVDAVKLAARKTRLWQLRRHPSVLRLSLKHDLKRQERVNGRVAYIEGCQSGDVSEWTLYFDKERYPSMLTNEDMDTWARFQSKPLTEGTAGLCAVSDGFFPFRDSIDVMAKNNVQWVMHPGGSIADQKIIEIAEYHKIRLIESGVRLFVH